MKSINTLKKTFILFCLAAISLNTVQPIHASDSKAIKKKSEIHEKNLNEDNKEKRPSNVNNVVKAVIGTTCAFVMVVLGYKYKDSGTKNEENPLSDRNDDSNDSSTSKPSNEDSNTPFISTNKTDKPSNQNNNSLGINEENPLSDQSDDSNASSTSEPLNKNSNLLGTNNSNKSILKKNQKNENSNLPPTQKKEIVVATSKNKGVFLFDLNGEPKRVLAYSLQNIKYYHAASPSPNGTFMAAIVTFSGGDSNRKIILVDPIKGVKVGEKEYYGENVNCLVWNPQKENQFIVLEIGKEQDKLYQFNIDDKNKVTKKLINIKKNSAKISHLCFSSDGNSIAYLDPSQKKLIVLDTNTNSCKPVLEFKENPNKLQFSLDGKCIACSTQKKQNKLESDLQIYQLDTTNSSFLKNPVIELTLKKVPCIKWFRSSMDFISNGKSLICPSVNDKTVFKLLSWGKEGKYSWDLSPYKKKVSSLDLSEDDQKFIFCAGQDIVECLLDSNQQVTEKWKYIYNTDVATYNDIAYAWVQNTLSWKKVTIDKEKIE